MLATFSLEEKKPGGTVLSIHFDVDENYLDLTTFIATANSARKVIEAFSDTYLGNAEEYRIFVLPPDDGSFLSRLGVWTRRSSLVLAGLLGDDAANGVIKALSGHEPTYWAEQATKSLLSAASSDFSQAEDRQAIEFALRDAECRMMVTITTNFLLKTPEELIQSGISLTSFPKGFLARNEFYDACIENPGVRAVGFSEEDDFPVPRSSFQNMQTEVLNEEEDLPWKVEITTIQVTSPNWDRGDKRRYWKGKDQLGKERLFKIEDEHFWSLARRRQLNVSVIDSIGVQWAYQEEHGRSRFCTYK